MNINYTATRNIVESGLNISASDIFLAAADNSINSTVSDLSGILAGYYVLLTGTAVDDGWHLVLSDSTANKIILDPASTVTNEAAGSLIGIVGYVHGDGISYDLETIPTKLDKKRKSIKNESTAMSGIVHSHLIRDELHWDISTGQISESQLEYWQEFFSSTSSREVFSFDPYGTIAVPNKPVSATLEGDETIERIEGTMIYTISFMVKINAA